MADEVAFVAESLAALGARLGFLARRGGDVLRVVVEVLVAAQQLLLSERLFTQVTAVGLLFCVYEHVRVQVPRRGRRVRAKITLETFFSIVSFVMKFESIPVGKHFATFFTFDWFVRGMKLLNVNSEISFPSTGSWAKIA